jgi:hypothetical protein
MPATLKKLHQSQLPAAVGTLFTVPAGQTWLIKSIRISNTDNAASHYFTLYDGGTATVNEILGQMTLQPNEVYVEGEFMVIETGGTLRAVADVASMVTITIYGVVMT